MKSLPFCSLLAVFAGWILVSEANALVTRHGSERVGCSGWSEGLTAIVNDQSRVSGEIGPLAPSARFQFDGDLEAFQRVLEKYAGLQQAQRVLYLQTGLGSGHDYELSITGAGQGFLHWNANGRIPLDRLKIPTGVAVEFLPDVIEPAASEAKAQSAALRAQLEAFAAAHKAQAAGK